MLTFLFFAWIRLDIQTIVFNCWYPSPFPYKACVGLRCKTIEFEGACHGRAERRRLPRRVHTPNRSPWRQLPSPWIVEIWVIERANALGLSLRADRVSIPEKSAVESRSKSRENEHRLGLQKRVRRRRSAGSAQRSLPPGAAWGGKVHQPSLLCLRHALVNNPLAGPAGWPEQHASRTSVDPLAVVASSAQRGTSAGNLRRVMCGLDSWTLRQIGRKRDGKAFWPCNMVVLVTPKRGLSMEEPDLE